MNIDSSSQYSSPASGETSLNGTDGPVPLPEESPFLSDHGLGKPAPPPTGRVPVVAPADLSQFPAPSATHPSSHPGTASAGRPSSHETGIQPTLSAAIPVQDALSSFAIFGGGEDPYAPGRGTQGISKSAMSNGNAEIMERLKNIQITSTDSLQGRLVELYLGMVTAEALVPTDILLEGAERTGRFSRYKTSQQKLKSLEQLVMAELKLEADKLGGNAVVGTEINVSMDHGVVLIVATGTAVRMV